MITAHELRMGNKIRIGEHVPNIGGTQLTFCQCVHQPHKPVGEQALHFFEGNSVEEKDCDGIPLTPELLELCGFVKDSRNGKYFHHPFQEGRRAFTLEMETEANGYPLERPCFSYREKTTNVFDVYDLHTLQNLFFALTREELTITL